MARKKHDPVQLTELEEKVAKESQPKAPKQKRQQTSGLQKNSKKSIPKAARTVQLFISLPEDKYFILADGRKLKDYKDLAEALTTLNEDIFYHHVNDSRNDFANWIEDVFADKILAENIRQLRDRMHMRSEIYKHLFEYLESALDRTE